ncbi:hypothetical protein G7Y89_g11157 [Cudoniella acicularis]|uniref:Autophagy-related protein 16 domain-containing protein n=1 Tax=Cudoniella acicularis TaxID=354080 RepID=A0A8H4W0W9_9HELO|nr:hypothetical protein G7Y89_g11157 [Cudoniella acicularis]
MASWRDEYMQALLERDLREKASYDRIDDELVEAFTQLLARTAALEAETAATEPPTQDAKLRDPAIDAAATEGDTQVKKDLAEALRSNTQLQSRLQAAEAELTILRAKTTADAKSIRDLTRERASLSQKAKDKDDELRQKARFLSDVQDEMISLNLQLNMSEQNAKKVKAENKELIERWLIHKGREAEAMNHTLESQSPGR